VYICSLKYTHKLSVGVSSLTLDSKQTAGYSQGFFSRTIFPKSWRKPEMPLPPRNCCTGQKKLANLNLNTDLDQIKNGCAYNRIAVCGVVVPMRTGFNWRVVVSSISSFCSLFLNFAAKIRNSAGSEIRARDQWFVSRKLLPLRH
jgi:hypothetical protein